MMGRRVVYCWCGSFGAMYLIWSIIINFHGNITQNLYTKLSNSTLYGNLQSQWSFQELPLHLSVCMYIWSEHLLITIRMIN